MKNGVFFVLLLVNIFYFGLTEISNKSEKTDLPVINVETRGLFEEGTDFFLKEKYELRKFEPVSSCYIGVFAEDYLAFDKKSEKKHSVAGYTVELGQIFSSKNLLKAIANNKALIITVMPTQEYDIYSEKQLHSLAESLSVYKVPLFIDLFPNPEEYEVLPENYIKAYDNARKIFESYCNDTAYVWSINIENVYSSQVYYPSNSADWVGLNIYKNISFSQEEEDIWQNLDFFYMKYQHEKPVMITKLAISHYTEENHRYYTNEAASQIEEFYTRVEDKYKRLKAINYFEYNSAQRYKISEHTKVTDAYKSAVGTQHFLSKIERAIEQK